MFFQTISEERLTFVPVDELLAVISRAANCLTFYKPIPATVWVSSTHVAFPQSLFCAVTKICEISRLQYLVAKECMMYVFISCANSYNLTVLLYLSNALALVFLASLRSKV